VEKQLQYTTEEWERRLGADARRLRLAQGVTQVELAQRANVSVSALKYLEWGRGSTLTTLIRVARALGRTSWLDALAPEEPSVSPMALLREGQRRAASAPRRARAPRAPR
jgi:transcriptional regulator with XRE-family HTH domain